MATITVPYTTFEDGRFPAVCCKTGEPANRYVRWSFLQTPGWTWVLLPLGIVPFIVVRAFITKEFAGVLPITTGAERRVRIAKRAALAVALAGLGVFFAAFTSLQWNSVALVLFAAAAVLLMLAYMWSPRAVRYVDHGTVELRNVHAGFVGAVEDARSAPPPVTETL